MKLLYLAGPYRAATIWQTHQNIQQAMRIGAEVIQRCPGWFPVIPHANTAYMDGLAEDAYFLGGTLELMRRCDALLVMGGEAVSRGTKMEIEEAQWMRKPIIYWHDHFDVWDLENAV